MTVTELQGADAVCLDTHGARHRVALDLLEAVAAGDRVLVHAGVAIGAL